MAEYPFLHSKRKKWETRSNKYYKELAGRYLKDTVTYTLDDGEVTKTYYKPIELPRNLFNEHIKQLLRDKFGDVEEFAAATAADNDKQWYNTTYLINLYFKRYLHDSPQPFYRTEEPFAYARSYKIFNVLNNKKYRNKFESVYYTIEQMEQMLVKGPDGVKLVDKKIKDYLSKVYKNREIEKKRLEKYMSEYKENEKIIRRYKVQDMLVFLMAKELLLGNSFSEEILKRIKKYKLKNISPARRDQDNSILSLPIPFHITLTMDDGTIRTIFQPELKLKNYGDFFKFVYDDRIRTLLPLVNKVKVSREELEKELDVYDNERADIFALAHSLERAALEMHPELKKETFVKGTLSKRNNFRALIETLGKWEETELNQMIGVRNAFGHNHYVEGLALGDTDLPHIAEEVWKIFSRMVKKQN